MTTIVFPCCFCSKPINEGKGSGVGLATSDVETGDFIQQWWCHMDCLLERMVPEARVGALGGEEIEWL